MHLPSTYTPPLWLRDGLAMTLHAIWWTGARWLETADDRPQYRSVAVPAADSIHLHGWLSPIDETKSPRGTIVATYGITGHLEDQWYLRQFGRRARDRGYAVLLLDWRAHGKSAEHSPVFTSDGIHEGRDFLHAADWLKTQGYPAPFFFCGYSLGGQLALWAARYGSQWDDCYHHLQLSDLGGVSALVPSLHSTRSLKFLASHDTGRRIDRSITQNIHHLVRNIHRYHPDEVDLSLLDRVRTIWDYDREYSIPRLGFATVEDYFDASSPLPFLPELTLPTQIIYAINDPMFDPTLVGDLRDACADNPAIDLMLTQYGGHVAHRSNRACQQSYGDPDCWWAMHRSLDWIDRQATAWKTSRDATPEAAIV